MDCSRACFSLVSVIITAGTSAQLKFVQEKLPLTRLLVRTSCVCGAFMSNVKPSRRQHMQHSDSRIRNLI